MVFEHEIHTNKSHNAAASMSASIFLIASFSWVKIQTFKSVGQTRERQKTQEEHDSDAEADHFFQEKN